MSMFPSATNPGTTPKASHLDVTVRNRTSVIFEGEATAITTVNERGLFDVLPEHTSFISIIKDSLTLHFKDGTQKDYKISRGVMKVYENEVHIYLGLIPVKPLIHSPLSPPK